MWPAGIAASFRPIDAGVLESAVLGAVVSANADGVMHCGIVYRGPGTLKYLHLAWEDELRHEEAPVGHLAGFSAFHVENQKYLARFCSKIARRHAERKPMHWGFGHAQAQGPIFDARGEWRGQPVALTCATFVLSLFEANGYTLVQRATWPDRPEDATWAAAMLAKLPEDAARREAARPTFGARVRPEESAIAVTARESDTPVTHAGLSGEPDTLRARTLANRRERWLARVRDRFGENVAGACTEGRLMGLLREGLPGVPLAVAATWARELRRVPGASSEAAILEELAVQLLRLLPPDLVSDQELALVTATPRLSDELEAKARSRAGGPASMTLFDLVESRKVPPAT